MRSARVRGDAGFTLVDVVIGLALTALGAGLLAHLLTNAAERATPRDITLTEVSLVADSFTRDVRDAVAVDVTVRRGAVSAVELAQTGDVVRWEFRGGRLTRELPAAPPAQELLDDIASGVFVLFDGTGAEVDPRDAAALACTRSVRLELVGDDGWSLDRTVALRSDLREATCA